MLKVLAGDQIRQYQKALTRNSPTGILQFLNPNCSSNLLVITKAAEVSIVLNYHNSSELHHLELYHGSELAILMLHGFPKSISFAHIHSPKYLNKNLNNQSLGHTAV